MADMLKMARIISGHRIREVNPDDADWLLAVQEQQDQLAQEVAAWRERFPSHRYSAKDDCVVLK